jgi:hypothetical protein
MDSTGDLAGTLGANSPPGRVIWIGGNYAKKREPMFLCKGLENPKKTL